MSRLASTLVLIAIWAVTYLTNLGASEFRSEEGHRVMPAVQMLDSGNYLLPYVGTQPHLRKAPLVNWIVAGSVYIIVIRYECNERMPSVYFVFSVVLILCLLNGPNL